MFRTGSRSGCPETQNDLEFERHYCLPLAARWLAEVCSMMEKMEVIATVSHQRPRRRRLLLLEVKRRRIMALAEAADS